VSAAISLTEPLQTLAARFKTRTGVEVRLNLAGSNTLATQVINGAPADIFLSADETQMNRVAGAGLLNEGSRVVLLSNRLVVVAPAASSMQPSVPGDLASASVRRFAIGDPAAVPVGQYAAAYLRARGVWSRLEPRLVFFPHVRAVTTAVEQGAADAGIVYRTDARAAKGVRVVLEIDEDPRWAISYPMALLARAPHPGDARAFAAFLQERDSLQIFQKAGFVVPGA
jgi:molybdate transport system substrate-binding protein